jgi:hypothetical protein
MKQITEVMLEDLPQYPWVLTHDSTKMDNAAQPFSTEITYDS